MSALFWLVLALQIYVSVASPSNIASQNTLTQYQQLLDGQTLVSSNQRFEMGFFCPHTPCKHARFLGVWYKDQPKLTVVWVANRNQPLKRALGGRLCFDINGSLVIEDNSGKVIWKRELMKKPNGAMAQKPILQLLDSGNLVVRDGIGKNISDGDEGFFWESFKCPTDTLLPGMKIGWDHKLGMDLMITSWKSADDPSNGEYSFGLDKSVQSPQLVLDKNNFRRSRWGPWDGERFSGSNAFKENPLFRPVLVVNDNKFSLTFEVLNESTLVRFVVTPIGDLRFFKWRNATKDWLTIITFNKDNCDKIGSCGPYGMCYGDDPSCICLDRFVANSPGDWRALDCSSGCRRRYELNCSDGDGFLKYEGLKLPDKSIVLAGFSPEECSQECLKNCKCMAYTILNVYGNESMCVVWLSDLVDLRMSPQAGDDIYIRMARRELEFIYYSKKKREVFITIIVLFSTFTSTLILGLLCRFLYQLWGAKHQDQGNNPSRESRANQEEVPDIILFDLDKIVAATNNFSPYNKIGHGGFGIVYKGELPGGVEVAVKRLCESSWQGLREFKNEVSLIAKLQHRNLVKLLGYCVQGNERMLVYEYMPNRSLDQLIFDQARRRLLLWATRYKIIKGVAKGLLYLHDDSRLRVIHRDLKASNVLLDHEMNPKISDFGLARIFANETQATTRRVIGTHGYMSPEYIMNGQFSTKSDVYSFGVLLLEVIRGEKNWGFQHPDHDLNLLGHGWKMWHEGRPLAAMDPALTESAQEDEVIRCIHVGLLCVQHQAEERPTMCEVVTMLRGDTTSLPEPHEPGFFSGRSIMGLGITTIGRNLDSVNGLTMTTLTAR